MIRLILQVVCGLLLLGAAKSTSTNYDCSRPTFDTGLTVMGQVTTSSTGRVMQVFRDGVALSSGDLYNPGESLSVSMSSTAGEQLLEVSGGAQFSGGSCDCSCRYYGGSTDVTMPGDDSDVQIWGGWATSYGRVSVTDKFRLVSSGIPMPTVSTTASPTAVATTTASPTAVATVSTTASPTAVDNSSSFSLSFEVASSGVTTSELQPKLGDLASVFCSHLSLTPSLCLITFISDAQLVSDDLQFDLLVTDFNTQTLANDANLALQLYLNDSSPTGFVEEFFTASNLRFSVATFQSSDVTETASTGSTLYAYSCDLSENLKLSWRVESQGDGVTSGKAGGYVSGSLTMLSGGSTPWFAAGVVPDDSLTMVDSPEHVVYFYEPNSRQAGMYRINAYSSSGIIADTRIRADTGVLGKDFAPSATSIDFQQSRITDVPVDPVLALDSVEQFNTIIWAHGGVWPNQHSLNNRGFTTVYWLEGACVASSESDFEDGKWFFIYISVLLVLSVCCAHLDRTAIKDLYLSFHLRRTLRQILPASVPLTHDMAAFTLRSSFVVAAFLAIVGIFLKQTANFYEDEKGYDTDRAYSFSLGHVALYLAALTTIPVNKTGIIVTLFRIPFDRATKFHRFCGALTMIMVVVHAIQIVGFWGASEVIQFDTTRKVGVAYPAYGLLGACCFGAMALTAPFPMRSRFYELFQLIHSLFLPALVFIILHVPKHDKRVLVFSLLFFALDWLLRAYQGILSVQNVSISSPYSKYTVLKVRAEHIKNVEPGQFCYVNVAAASIFQWHPISICSYDRETQEVTFVIKNVGDWTAKICDVVNSASMDSLVGDDVFRVRLCGPYGRIRYNVGADKEKNLYQYSNLVLVAGGIGCTPMISTLQWLIDNANDRGNEHGIHVTFLISARDHEMFSLFAEYFKKFNDSKVFQKGGMDLRLYCTTDQRSGSEVASMQNALEIQTLHTSEVVPFFASSVANLSVPITHGRPDLGKEIESVCACRESDKSKVCVLVCGPAGIVTAVQKGCYAAVKKFGPVLDLHEESFRI